MSENLKKWCVTLNNWQGSPRRFNNYLKAVRNQNAMIAEQKLRFLISPCCVALRKLIKSAIANASQEIENAKKSAVVDNMDINNLKNTDVNKLIIAEATAGRGRFLKRVVFRGRGRVGKVTKFSSNITIALQEKKSTVLKQNKNLKESDGK